MSKKEFHYINSNSGSEYSWKFEIQSKIGRFFFNFKPPLKNGYCNLGCGYRFLENYVNADFFQFNIIRTILRKPKLERQLDWQIDLRYKINCNDNFFHGIFAEHVLEHLTIFDGLETLKELRRILKKDGVIRISVPDLNKYVKFYCKKKVNKKFDNWIGLRSEALWSLNHNFGHHSVYDFDLLNDLLGRAGFRNIKKKAFNESSDENLKIDDIGRKWESLYVEATK